jgi:hypothetical protein
MSLQLQQLEELPKLQSGFADSFRVATTTTKTAAHGGRDVSYHLAINLNEQDWPLKLIPSCLHLLFMTGNLKECFNSQKQSWNILFESVLKLTLSSLMFRMLSGCFCIAPVAKVPMALKLLSICIPGLLSNERISSKTFPY